MFIWRIAMLVEFLAIDNNPDQPVTLRGRSGNSFPSFDSSLGPLGALPGFV
jgi:hypothetical protein